ncbi:hypothetical protein ONE63_001134 [Megalurothrips usitatus]|nr:hypothetical protein ONE63_001134 [Megalurothrips usitatus]
MICLPKEDKLCVCHMCKTRLQTWDSFIDSCKKTQAKLKELLGKDEYADLLGLSEESVGPGETSVNLSLSQPRKKKSSNYCIARWCNNGNYQGISLFRLPKERERALKWLAAADRTDLQGRTVLHSLYLCAKHFTSNMFTNKACNQLIKKAIPTLFPKSPSPNKKLSTAATSQVQPTQLQGVQLKHILPKVSLLKNSQTQPTVIVMESNQKVPTINDPPNAVDAILLDTTTDWSQQSAPEDVEEGSTVVMNVISSEMCETIDTYSNILNIPNLDASSVVHLNSIPSGLPQIHSGTNASLGVQESCNVVDSLVAWSVLPCESQVLGSVSETQPPIQHASMLPQIGLKKTLTSGNNSKSKPGVQKDQKLYLEELEECFTSDAFSEDAMLSADCTGDSLKPKILKISRTIGSQDFLLPHVSVKLDKPNSSVRTASFTLKSDETNEVPREEAKEQNTIIEHNMNPNTNTILFDLNSDDTHGTDNSSFINNIGNLDDLMDLDHYFDGR